MNEPPTAAEVQQAKLDKDSPAYYRFNVSGMHAMLLTMAVADVIADGDKAPKFPEWPPKDTPAARKELLEEALYSKEPATLAKLTPAEKKRVREVRAQFDKVLSTHSAQKGKVPAYKFGSNEGWIVAGDECTLIATKLRSFAGRATQADLDKVDRAYAKAQADLEARIMKGQPAGAVSLTPASGLGMSLAEYKIWILDWASYNAVAAKHGGYHVD